MRIIAVLVVFCVSFALKLAVAADGSTVTEDAIPLCTVLSAAAQYDGKEITVRGLYRMVLHGSVLMSPECEHDLVNMRQAADYKADKRVKSKMRSLTKKNQFQSVDVVLRGTFRMAHQGECFGQNCLRYKIEDHELLYAKAPDSGGSSGSKVPKGTAQPRHADMYLR
jgi:hypothetical protein